MNKRDASAEREELAVSRRIDALCDRFEAEWKAGRRPELNDYIKQVEQANRAALLIELMRIELEFRIRERDVVGGAPSHLEELLDRCDDTELDSDTILELIGHEYGLRLHAGDRPEIAEYQRRFPALEAKIEPALRAVAQHVGEGAELGAAEQDPSSAEKSPSPLPVRCPHCLNPIEIADDDESFDEITCPACGSTFNLLGNATETLFPDVPQRIAHFKLLDKLGVGAFGTVWKARDTELDRIVAVKIPRSSQLTSAEAELFLREARAAAQLTHPNIVGVHEVGRTDAGIYIVSDFVAGVTLGDWLTGQRLLSREAAELGLKLSGALEYAHEAGVIHRDLKPGNVIIDLDGEPHLMDFGLAKREAGEITMTIEGRVLGTPAYMSPEQARGEGHRADRRTDVYSLGVILFECLTGELPFRGNPRMLLHQVLTQEPSSPRSLNDKIPRDLETICLKAMAKDAGRRYRSAGAMSDDLRRFLDDVPILARPVGSLERGWRWAKRNPTVAGLAASLAIALFVGLASVTWQWLRAEKSRREAVASRNLATENLAEAERQEQRALREALRANAETETAEAVSDFLAGLFQGSDFFGFEGYQFEDAKLGRSDLNASDLLKLGATAIDKQLADRPLIQAKLFDVIATTYLSRGYVADCAPLMERALEIRRELHDGPHSDLADSLRNTGMLRYIQGYRDEAERLIREACQMRSLLDDAPPLEAAHDKFYLAWVLVEGDNQYDESERLFQDVLRVRRAELGDQDRRVAYAITGLALVYLNTERYNDALNVVSEGVSQFENLEPDANPLLPLETLINAAVFLEARDLEGARAEVLKSIGQARRLFGDHHIGTIFLQYVVAMHAEPYDRDFSIQLLRQAINDARDSFGNQPRTADLTNVLSVIYGRESRYEEAIAAAHATLDVRRMCFGDKHAQVAESLADLASLLAETGQYDRALDLRREVLDMHRDLLGHDDEQIAVDLFRLGELQIELGDHLEAERLLQQALAIDRASYDEPHEDIAIDFRELATLYADMREYDRAAQMAETAVSMGRELAADEDHEYDVTNELIALARVKRRMQQFEEARTLLKEVLDIRSGDLERPLVQVAYAIHDLAHIERTAGRLDEAKKHYNQALTTKRDELSERDPSIAATLGGLGIAQMRAGEFDQAEASLREAVEIRRNSQGVMHLSYAKEVLRLASLLRRRGQLEEARRLAREGLTIRKRWLSLDDLRVAEAQGELAHILVDRGEPSEARLHLIAEVGILRRTLPPDDELVLTAIERLAQCLSQLAEFAEAEEMLHELHDVAQSSEEQNEERLQRTLERLVELYEAWEKPDQAARYRAQLSRLPSFSD